MIDKKKPNQQEINTQNPQSDSMDDASPKLPISVPYEMVLAKAFDKLTSEILIFLLAYTILLIGLLYFGFSISDSWINLLYLIPILGVLAYIWLQQGGIREYAKDKTNMNLRDVKVTSLVARDDAYVGGVRGALNQLNNVSVTSLWASGQSTTVGYDSGPSRPNESAEEENRVKPLTQVMLEHFEKLDEGDQLKTIQSVRKKVEMKNKNA